MFQQQHEILPRASHDEFAREEFCASLRRLFTTDLWPGNREIYQKQQLPEYLAKHQREPQNFREAREMMQHAFYWRASSLLGRTAQELVWDTTGEAVERQLDSLIETAKPRASDLGTVRVNSALPIPKYIEAVDIHVMPGNFHTELCADDVYAGALYDRGVYRFAFGGLGPRNDNLGKTMAGFIREEFPAFRPRRILDIGCGPAFTTLPFTDFFPDAEVHAIDIAAPQVRYAHRRAEALGKRLHVSQQDGVRTDFPDGHFDLVFSCLVLHECPMPVIKGIFLECHRLLAKGGLTLHDGYENTGETTPLMQLMSSFFGHNINEPFSLGLQAMDYRAALVEAGFAADRYVSGTRPPAYLQGHLPPVGYVGAFQS
jgi:SAM-dependent methyltransferase